MLINKAHVRARILERAKVLRVHKFDRVGNDVYQVLDQMLADKIDALIQRQPSMGKTIRP